MELVLFLDSRETVPGELPVAAHAAEGGRLGCRQIPGEQRGGRAGFARRPEHDRARLNGASGASE
jgi:hypothetical protein